MRRQLALAIAVLLLASLVYGSPVAQGVRRGDPRKERERVRAQRAAVASRLNVQKASLGKIDTALQALDADLASQLTSLGQANQELLNARRRLGLATAAVARSKRHISRVRAKMRERAVAAYMNPPSVESIDLLRVQSVRAATYRQMYGEVKATNDADLSDELKSASADLEFARRQAADARRRAQTKQAEQLARTKKLRAARLRQQAFSSALKRRIDGSVAKAIRLARTDRALSTRIALEQAALAARLAAARAAAAAAAQAAHDRAAAAAAVRTAAAAASRHNTIRANGSESRALPPVTVQSGSSGSGGISLSTVNGITVNSQIAGRLGSLVSAARSAGLNLTGGGYRSPSQQIALRQSHCGSSYYAIYQMSAGSCRPPTAPPGRSMHEVGLAIDFSNCSSRSSANYQWLAGNASRFGFFNLPSEPWHWSINGN